MISSSPGLSRRPINTVVEDLAKRRQTHGTLYEGVTSQLLLRIYQHREGLIPGFTKTYGLKRLVWFEPQESMIQAIHREKQLKKYKREWKINLIEWDNPHWDDLYLGFTG
jgi:putative endonuclease